MRFLGSTTTFLVSLVLFVILFVNLASANELQVKVTNALLEEICSATSDANFCLQVLKSNPRTASTDLRGLALISLDLTEASATKTYATINALIKQEPNAQLKSRYVFCSRKYASAIGELGVARRYWQIGDYKGVYNQVSGAVEDVENCGDEFEVPPPVPIQLRQKINDFGKLGVIVLVIAQRVPALY
ncbi:pectinesterase inhibitor-like [Actinidia eriantha]|uniref:pectinesterase inhibitor-like n=1 Tax=Actinidia eriantha TaxID=165200 RepID=UPI0025849033|nr:pectinesterase inhibitor-like [Actinidia eriantha]